MNDTTIGLDIAKNIFHLVELNARGKLQRKKMLRRAALLPFFAQLPPCRIALEACSSGHYWARELQALGHTVILLPPQHVKAYLRGQKNDYNDAAAIAEAAHHGAIRGVPIKSIDQQEEQLVHRIRARLVRDRTALANQLRGMLSEHGIVIARGISQIRRAIPVQLNKATLSVLFRDLLQRQYDRLCGLDEEIAYYDLKLKRLSGQSVQKRLQQLPGFGPVVSSAFSCWLGDGQQFKRGRDAAAALGVVPRQHSSGGKPMLLSITKRGDSYVRSLLIHGARSVVRCADKKDDRLSLWIQSVKARRGTNKAAVALANKLARIAWAMVINNRDYEPNMAY